MICSEIDHELMIDSNMMMIEEMREIRMKTN